MCNNSLRFLPLYVIDGFMTSQAKRALISGIAGQDGAYLARLLLDKGYEVHGVDLWGSALDSADALERLSFLGLEAVSAESLLQPAMSKPTRPFQQDSSFHQSLHYVKLKIGGESLLSSSSSSSSSSSISPLMEGAFFMHSGDLTDAHFVNNLLADLKPDEIYHLAAPSHVQESFKTPAKALSSIMTSALNIFEGVKLLGLKDCTKIYLASSSEMFGNADHTPQNEDTPMRPCSPYGVAKLAAHHLAGTYRRAYGLQICCGILFNHESPLRAHDFVTRKISKGVAAIEAGTLEFLSLGNLEAKRDWGHAADYVEGMWQMLQQNTCDDYVLATGEARSVRAFVEHAFDYVGRSITWQGKGEEEVGIDQKTQQILVRVDPQFYRPLELHVLCGDASRAQKELGWGPNTLFPELVREMVKVDLRRLGLRGERGAWKKVG